MTMISIKPLTKAYEKHCDKLVKKSSGLFFQSTAWRNFLSRHLAAEDCSLAIFSDKELVGFLPLLIKNGPIGVIANSLPYYGSNGGIVLDPALSPSEKNTVIQKISVWLQESIASKMYSAICIIGNPLSQTNDLLRDYYIPQYIDNRIGQFTKFPDKSEQLLSGLKTRRIVRKSLNAGYIYESCTCDESRHFLFETHIANMKIIGGNAKQKRFFQEALSPENRDLNYEIWVAKKGKKIIAALLVFLFHDVVEYFTPVIKAEYRSNQPLSGIIYTAMMKYIDLGFKKWNWGGTWLSQEGVYRFKKRWNAIDLPYDYLIYCDRNFKYKFYDFSRFYLEKKYHGFYLIPYSVLP